jgi:GDSL-like lipase/acylhydrolase family protein
MTKVTLNSVGSLRDSTTAQTNINDNFDTIETEFDNTLSRDGTSPNEMEADFDMNSNRILNLPDPISNGEPVNLQTLNGLIIGTGNLPAGGATNDYLVKNSNSAFDAKWRTGVLAADLPNPSATTLGGVKSKALISGQFLNSIETDGDVTSAVPPSFVGDSGSGGVVGYVPAPASGDSAANKFLHAGGTWQTIPQPYTGTPRRALLFGDSIFAGDTRTGSTLHYCSQGIFSWFNKLSGQRLYLDPTLNKGVGGDKVVTNMVPRFSSDVLANANNFDIAFIMGGHNDVAVNSASSVLTSLISFVDQLLALNKWVVLFCVLPDSLGAAASNRNFYNQINSGLKDWARTKRTGSPLFLVDCYRDVTDPTSTIGVPASTPVPLIPDGVHPGSGGAYILGKRLLSYLEAHIPQLSTSADGYWDTWHATENPNGNLVTNGAMAGTGGTITNGSGSLATSWTLVRPGGSTWLNAEVVASKQAQTSGFGATIGEKQILTINVASVKGANETIVLTQTVNCPTVVAQYYCGMDIDISGAQNLKEVSISAIDAGGNFVGDGVQGAGSVTGYWHTDTMNGLVYRSPFFTPVGGTTTFSFVIKAIVDASSTNGKVTLAISNPYLKAKVF